MTTSNAKLPAVGSFVWILDAGAVCQAEVLEHGTDKAIKVSWCGRVSSGYINRELWKSVDDCWWPGLGACA